MLETINDQLAESLHKASRLSHAVGEAVDDGIMLTKRAVRHGCDAAEEFIGDTQQRMKRHPLGAVMAAFAVGAAVGALFGFFARRK